jgi:hypothetical protein
MAIQVVIRAIWVTGWIAGYETSEFPIEVAETEVIESDRFISFLCTELAIFSSRACGSYFLTKGFIIGGCGN